MNQQNYGKYSNSIIRAPTVQYPDRQFQLLKLLGEGGEGGVFQAKQTNGDPKMSNLAIKLQKSIKEEEKLFTQNLIEYQNQFENPESQQYYPSCCIRIYEQFTWNELAVVVMEAGGENLFDFLAKNRNLNLIQKGDICKQIGKSIQMLHHFKYIHRDIKPENFIKFGNDFKLIDFGLTKQFNEAQTKQIGTVLYMAPEILSQDVSKYTEKVDVWSLGCVFYEIITGEVLFDGKIIKIIGQTFEGICELIVNCNLQGLYKINGKNQRMSYLQYKFQKLTIVADNWRHALSQMVEMDPQKRKSIPDIMNLICGTHIAKIEAIKPIQMKPIIPKFQISQTIVQETIYQQEIDVLKTEQISKQKIDSVFSTYGPQKQQQIEQKQVENQIPPATDQSVNQDKPQQSVVQATPPEKPQVQQQVEMPPQPSNILPNAVASEAPISGLSQIQTEKQQQAEIDVFQSCNPPHPVIPNPNTENTQSGNHYINRAQEKSSNTQVPNKYAKVDPLNQDQSLTQPNKYYPQQASQSVQNPISQTGTQGYNYQLSSTQQQPTVELGKFPTKLSDLKEQQSHQQEVKQIYEKHDDSSQVFKEQEATKVNQTDQPQQIEQLLQKEDPIQSNFQDVQVEQPKSQQKESQNEQKQGVEQNKNSIEKMSRQQEKNESLQNNYKEKERDEQDQQNQQIQQEEEKNVKEQQDEISNQEKIDSKKEEQQIEHIIEYKQASQQNLNSNPTQPEVKNDENIEEEPKEEDKQQQKDVTFVDQLQQINQQQNDQSVEQDLNQNNNQNESLEKQDQNVNENNQNDQNETNQNQGEEVIQQQNQENNGENQADQFKLPSKPQEDVQVKQETVKTTNQNQQLEDQNNNLQSEKVKVNELLNIQMAEIQSFMENKIDQLRQEFKTQLQEQAEQIKQQNATIQFLLQQNQILMSLKQNQQVNGDKESIEKLGIPEQKLENQIEQQNSQINQGSNSLTEFNINAQNNYLENKQELKECIQGSIDFSFVTQLKLQESNQGAVDFSLKRSLSSQSTCVSVGYNAEVHLNQFSPIQQIERNVKKERIDNEVSVGNIQEIMKQPIQNLSYHIDVLSQYLELCLQKNILYNKNELEDQLQEKQGKTEEDEVVLKIFNLLGILQSFTMSV